jgi:hypothetical protein
LVGKPEVIKLGGGLLTTSFTASRPAFTNPILPGRAGGARRYRAPYRGVSIKEGDTERGISWSDMAVLLRSVRTNGEPITKALAQAHIPYVVVGMNNLFGTAEAEAARQLFYFMAGWIDAAMLEVFWLNAGAGINLKQLQRAIATSQKFRMSFDDPTERFGFYSIQRTFLAFLDEAGVREVVAKGLSTADPVVLNAAAVFFAMSIDSHLYSAEMYAARLHDTTRGAVTVKTLLTRAGHEAGAAKYGTASEVRAEIDSSQKVLAQLKSPLDTLTKRRNLWLAHTDPRTLTNPTKMAKHAAPNFLELKRIFVGSGKIVNEFSRLFLDITNMLELIGQTDYETVIRFVSDAKCEQARRYEAEFGVPAPFPRPKFLGV